MCVCVCVCGKRKGGEGDGKRTGKFIFFVLWHINQPL